MGANHGVFTGFTLVIATDRAAILRAVFRVFSDVAHAISTSGHGVAIRGTGHGIFTWWLALSIPTDRAAVLFTVHGIFTALADAIAAGGR